MAAKRICRVFDLTKGLTSYETAWRYQKALLNACAQAKKAKQPTFDSIVFVQHKPVYTLGKGATLSNLHFSINDDSHELYRIERGGEVTYHGPGQLVLYPIFDLDQHKRDLHWFSRTLEESVIGLLSSYGLQAERSALNAGVWVLGKSGSQTKHDSSESIVGANFSETTSALSRSLKIAAIGITASRWITMHGIALNVTTDLAAFTRIVPCGIDPAVAGVTNMRTQLPGLCDSGSETEVLQQVASRWIHSVERAYSVQMQRVKQPQAVLDGLVSSLGEELHLQRPT